MATEGASSTATAAVARLRKWALSPEGQAKFGWGKPGDFEACQSFYKGKVPAHMVDGWCARLHKLATGEWPGKNAHGGSKDKG